MSEIDNYVEITPYQMVVQKPLPSNSNSRPSPYLTLPLTTTKTLHSQTPSILQERVPNMFKTEVQQVA